MTQRNMKLAWYQDIKAVLPIYVGSMLIVAIVCYLFGVDRTSDSSLATWVQVCVAVVTATVAIVLPTWQYMDRKKVEARDRRKTVNAAFASVIAASATILKEVSAEAECIEDDDKRRERHMEVPPHLSPKTLLEELEKLPLAPLESQHCIAIALQLRRDCRNLIDRLAEVQAEKANRDREPGFVDFMHGHMTARVFQLTDPVEMSLRKLRRRRRAIANGSFLF